jgi:hypothetical protein
VEAGFVKEEKKGLWGAVLISDSGNTILSAWRSIPNSPSSKTPEVVSVLQGINSILSISAKPVHVELDCAGDQ